jgi:hypothetical protein
MSYIIYKIEENIIFQIEKYCLFILMIKTNND